MERNPHPEFVGIPRLKARHAQQVGQFREWAGRARWGEFHQAHYDWWAFPIDKPSAYGWAYSVFPGDVEELKQDPAFVRDYLEGASLLARSWGWDLEARRCVPDPTPEQTWAHWPIRLHKAASSLLLFGYPEPFESFRLYALDLIGQGQSMEYRGRDLGELFRNGPP